MEALLGIEFAIIGAEPPAALRNHSDAAPGTIGYFENFSKQLLRGAVAFKSHYPAVCILDFVSAGFELNHGAADSFEQIERLESGDDNGQRNFSASGGYSQ